MRTTADQLAAVLDHWQSGTGPLYQQLAGAIVSLAESGSLEYGTRLPSERALAECLHLSRNTVTAAYHAPNGVRLLDLVVPSNRPVPLRSVPVRIVLVEVKNAASKSTNPR